ncbi:restriction endonuclease [Halorussus halobius]|uniref:restriction endonuclease n=1 Tax=Halorussus halobius TaxID=1710537 RepID=UPI00143CE73C|nr:restriction endonuclease [Halorussus halobius]
MSKAQERGETITRLQEIDRYEFEDFVAEIFELAGWDTEVTQDSADGGVDVIAHKNTLYQEKASIQAKRPDPGNKVGRPEVQQYSSIDRSDIDTDIVILATSAAFTRGAYEFARDKNVKLIDGAMLAGFVEAQEAEEILDEYAPSIESINLDAEEVFSPVEEPRKQYLRKRPIEASARIFREKDLIDAVGMIQNTEVGLQQINCLDRLRQTIFDSDGEIPIDVFQEYPQVIDQNWYDVERLEGVTDEIIHSADGGRVTPSDFEILCFSNEGSIFVSVLLAPTNQVGHQEFSFLEACVDSVAKLSSATDDNPNGCIYGGELGNIERRLGRNRDFGITASTYSKALERTVQVNQELLSAVKPYFRVSEDQDTLEKIDQLQDEVNQSRTQ